MGHPLKKERGKDMIIGDTNIDATKKKFDGWVIVYAPGRGFCGRDCGFINAVGDDEPLLHLEPVYGRILHEGMNNQGQLGRFEHLTPIEWSDSITSIKTPLRGLTIISLDNLSGPDEAYYTLLVSKAEEMRKLRREEYASIAIVGGDALGESKKKIPVPK